VFNSGLYSIDLKLLDISEVLCKVRLPDLAKKWGIEELEDESIIGEIEIF